MTSEVHPGRPTGAEVGVKSLWKVYGPHPERFVGARAGTDALHTTAVRDVSFTVSPGETFVVMGLSGSGKSTLVRCLTRLIEPTSGDVTLDGRSVVAMSDAELRELRREELAMVFQHFGLLPHRTVIDNVAYGLEITGIPRKQRLEQAAQVLELVGLNGWENRHPAQLSGGMRQRVGLARALAVKPRLLLLDEPFSALDPLIRRELQDELLRLRTSVDQTSIFITHDMSEALKLGDRIAIMRDGEIVQIGTPEEIVLHPADDYVARFSEDTSRLRVVRAGTVAFTTAVVGESATVAEAASALRRARADRPDTTAYLFVVDESGRPIGALDEEALRGAPPENQASALVRRIASVREGEPLGRAVSALADSACPVAVLGSDGAVTGAVDRDGLLTALAEGDAAVPAADGSPERDDSPGSRAAAGALT